MALRRTPPDLPRRVPIFPLSGAMVLPFGRLPLNVFEPRYLNLVDDALGAGRLIGIIQPVADAADPVPDDAPLYDVGTAARIIEFHDLGSGTYAITLEGLSRFRIQNEEPLDPRRGYRVVTADYAPFKNDMQPTEQGDGPGRTRILDLMRIYFDDQDIEANWRAVSDAPYEALVSSLAMTCPFAPSEKQALLECDSPEQRANMLISLLEMNIDDGGGGLTH